VATASDKVFLSDIAFAMNLSTQKRGTGIGQRSLSFLQAKVEDQLAVIAIDKLTQQWMGFCYLEPWTNLSFIAVSGLIVAPQYRNMGLSRWIKNAALNLSLNKFPQAIVFSLSSSTAVHAVNKELGYRVIAIEELLNDNDFLFGQQSWVDYLGIMKNQEMAAHYLAMIYTPKNYILESGSLNSVEMFGVL